MATLAAITPSRTGAASAGAAVAASDVIPAILLGQNGCLLEILNGNASTDNMTISDFGTTQSGSPLASNSFSVSVTNATNKIFKILPAQGDPANNMQVTVTHSVTSTVTYKLYPLG
jgi:hypothetical protein